MTAIKRPTPVHVRGPLLARESVPTAHGFVAAEVGDFILRDEESGDEWPIKADIFARTYIITEPTLDQDEKSERPAVTEFELIKREGS